MRALLGLALAFAVAAPAHARAPILAVGQNDSGAARTTLTLVDPETLAPMPGSLTVAGGVWRIQGSPDGTRLVTLGNNSRLTAEPRITEFSTLTFADTATLRPIGDPVELEGNPWAALWADPRRLLVVTNRGQAAGRARVTAIDTVTHAITSRTELDGAPGDSLRVGDRLVVVDTNRRHEQEGTIEPALRVFAADGTQERRISLTRLATKAAPRLTYIHLAAHKGKLIVLAAASGRLATVDPATGRLTVIVTRLRSEQREPILGVTARTLIVQGPDPNRKRVFSVQRRTGRATLLRRSGWQLLGTGNGWVSWGHKLARYDARGRLRWRVPGRRGGCLLQRYAGIVYSCEPSQEPLALDLRTGEELGRGTAPGAYPGVIGESDGGYLYTFGLGTANRP